MKYEVREVHEKIKVKRTFVGWGVFNVAGGTMMQIYRIKPDCEAAIAHRLALTACRDFEDEIK